MISKVLILENAAGTGFDLILNPRLDRQMEMTKLVEVIQFLHGRLHFEADANLLEIGIPPFLRFKEKNGVSLTVAMDNFDGLSIESNSREFLEGLKETFEREGFWKE